MTKITADGLEIVVPQCASVPEANDVACSENGRFAMRWHGSLKAGHLTGGFGR
jgi:hypothetical protein